MSNIPLAAYSDMHASLPPLQGACGFGMIPKDRWPSFSVAALSPNNSFYKESPVNGCGMCFQIQCISAWTSTQDRYHPGGLDILVTWGSCMLC
jgi:hypothetical protein